MTMCQLSHFVTFAEEKQSLHCIGAGYPLSILLQTSPSLFSSSVTLCSSAPFLTLSSPQMLLSSILYFLSNRLLSGHASDPSVIFLYAFYLNFISDFVIIYSLIYLGLFMHAVCETDSCIYQWNRVRS